MTSYQNAKDQAARNARDRDDLSERVHSYPGMIEAEDGPRRTGPTILESIRDLPPRAVAFSGVAVWCFLILVIALNLPTSAIHWVSVSIFGILLPVVLVAQAERAIRVHEARPALRAEDGEHELLGALSERGELTPTAAAMRTPLTVDEASKMLERLARKGYIEARVRDGALVYALRDHDLGDAGMTATLAQPPSKDDEVFSPLDEPLSEREQEVLKLLASGRTNREIAHDLFVTIGTVKSHTSNIYGKLRAKNRTEALSRARSLGLLE